MKKWRLFWEMFTLSALVVGGGYVILSVADERFSRKLKWLKEGELFDRLPLFQMVPGIIGGHTAVYIGQRVAGLWGAAVALLGMVLPSVMIFSAISFAYSALPLESPLLGAAFIGLRAALTGVMAEVVVRSWLKCVQGIVGVVAVIVALLLLWACHLSPGAVILLGLSLGVAVSWWRKIRVTTNVFRCSLVLPLLFALYGLMAFGGGFVLIPVFLRDFVGPTAAHLQLPAADFASVVALTQMTPGPVAINCATFFGFRMAGFPGALISSLALVLPGSLILLLALKSIERFRESFIVRGVFLGVRPVTMALIVSATFAIARMSLLSVSCEGMSISPLACIIALASFFAVKTRRLGAVTVILISALIALTCQYLDFTELFH